MILQQSRAPYLIFYNPANRHVRVEGQLERIELDKVVFQAVGIS
jgi:hypothetical protein